MDLRIGKSENRARASVARMSAATSGFSSSRAPHVAETCHHCASAIALVFGRAFARPGGSSGLLASCSNYWEDLRMKLPHTSACLMSLTILAATIALPALARAQTYDPRYPVCLQIYQGIADFYFE